MATPIAFATDDAAALEAEILSLAEHERIDVLNAPNIDGGTVRPHNQLCIVKPK